LEARLKEKGSDSDKILEIVNNQLPDDLTHANTPGFYDATIVADDLEEAYTLLHAFIYNTKANGEVVNGETAEEAKSGEKDVAMEDAPADGAIVPEQEG
jgi:guanylate kinase